MSITGPDAADTPSECDRAIARYEEWLVLREKAIANHRASGSTEPLPKSLTTEPPPRPDAYVDEGACDVSVDMMANGFDISESFTMDKSQADEVVPVADPGIEARTVSYVLRCCVEEGKGRILMNRHRQRRHRLLLGDHRCWAALLDWGYIRTPHRHPLRVVLPIHTSDGSRLSRWIPR